VETENVHEEGETPEQKQKNEENKGGRTADSHLGTRKEMKRRVKKRSCQGTGKN